MDSFYLYVFSISILFSAIESIGHKGMTWSVNSGWYDPILNVDAVNCDYCNPYVGDTSCNNKLPILCVSTCNFKRPPYNPKCTSTCGGPPSFYDGWSDVECLN